jgi:hypothetical protein
MGSPYPVLYNGLGVSQGIYDIVTSPVVAIGTRAALADGRVFYYARSTSATALGAGLLCMAEIADADMDDMVTGTTVVGDTVILMTSAGSKTYAANELAEGYFCYAAGTTGGGIAYKIKSHNATGATAEYTINLYDGLAIAGSSDAKATVGKNPWMDPVIATQASQPGIPTGVPQMTVPAGDSTTQYYWSQTWGAAGVVAGSATVCGTELMNDTGTDGETLVLTEAMPKIGIAHSLGVQHSTAIAFLTIAP